MTTILSDYARVTYDVPCPICGKPDWCLIAVNGESALCQRVESGWRRGDAGYYHLVGNKVVHDLRPEKVNKPDMDWDAIHKACMARCNTERFLDWAALRLGLAVSSLLALEVGIEHATNLSFPMLEADGSICGIRVRSMSGDKWAVRYSNHGLFFHEAALSLMTGPMVVCEGPTDTAALLQVGLFAVGKPSCNAGDAKVIDLIKRTGTKEVIVMADADGPGRAGAYLSAERYAPHVRSVKVIEPYEAKDAREMLRNGTLTRHRIQRMAEMQPQWSAT